MSEDDIVKPRREICGVVRPISGFGDYTAQHWSDVAQVIDEAIDAVGYEPSLVSDAESVGIIHARIVKNLYTNPVIVCDISGKNPNVMLELGMRLAFDKPVVVIKDDTTDYSFDTSPIEHVTYPRSLHYQDIVNFKRQLGEKICATIVADGSDSFLQQFNPIKLPELVQERVPEFELIRSELSELKSLIRSQVQKNPAPTLVNTFKLSNIHPDRIDSLVNEASLADSIDKVVLLQINGQTAARVKPDSIGGWTQEDANDEFRKLLAKYRTFKFSRSTPTEIP